MTITQVTLGPPLKAKIDALEHQITCLKVGGSLNFFPYTLPDERNSVKQLDVGTFGIHLSDDAQEKVRTMAIEDLRQSVLELERKLDEL